MKKLIVFGGSGFLGQELLKEGLSAGYHVQSISRHGQSTNAKWATQVKWLSADLLLSNEWKQEIHQGDILIDSIGLLFEKKSQGLTYEKLHYQVAALISNAAKEKKAGQLVYISAAHGLPFFKEYLKQKKKAEQIVLENFPKAMIIRPSLMYGKQRQGTRNMAKLILLSKQVPLFTEKFKEMNPLPVEKVAQEVIESIKKSER